MSATGTIVGQGIVVGVDGSSTSRSALAWAAKQARMTGARLYAVAAWQFPSGAGLAPALPADFDPARDAEEFLTRTLTEVLGPEPGIDVETVVAEGSASSVLTELSRNASLVVVGNRGHGELAGMLLGSVSEFLTTHAHCPVVVIRKS